MSAPEELEIVTTRTVPFPRERVFRAWTEVEHLARWWGPNGFTNTFDVFDPKPGGDWRFVMHGPNGKDFPNHHVFVEVAPERIVLDHITDHFFRIVATFDEASGGTAITFRMQFETAAECERVKAFALPLNVQVMDRLEAELARMG